MAGKVQREATPGSYAYAIIPMITDPSSPLSKRSVENGIRISPNHPSSVMVVSRSQKAFHERFRGPPPPLPPRPPPSPWAPPPVMLMSIRVPRGSPTKRTAFSLSSNVSRRMPKPSSPLHRSRVREKARMASGSS